VVVVVNMDFDGDGDGNVAASVDDYLASLTRRLRSASDRER
jgi:membrane-bound lytic murein transglycosylase B